MAQHEDGGTTVAAALREFRDMMARDGYELSWSEIEDRRIVVEIAAGPDACSDCLVPKPVMESIMSDALDATPYRLDRVVLPAKEA